MSLEQELCVNADIGEVLQRYQRALVHRCFVYEEEKRNQKNGEFEARKRTSIYIFYTLIDVRCCAILVYQFARMQFVYK